MDAGDSALAALGPRKVIDCRAKEGASAGGLRPVDEITDEAWAAVSAHLARR